MQRLQGGAVYRTDDGGATWAFHGVPGSRKVTALALDPDSRARLYAATDDGIWERTVVPLQPKVMPTLSPTPLPLSPTTTPTATQTATATATATATFSPTPTVTSTATATITVTATPTRPAHAQAAADTTAHDDPHAGAGGADRVRDTDHRVVIGWWSIYTATATREGSAEPPAAETATPVPDRP